MDEAGFDRELDCLASPGAAALPVISVRPDALEAALAGFDPAVAGFVRGGGFTAAAGELVLVPGPEGLAGALLGLGTERSPWTHAGLPMALPEGSVWRLEPGDFDPGAAVLGFCLGAYQYTRLTKPKRLPALLQGAEGETAALATARAVWLARDLINTPANLLGPAELAEAALALGRRHGAECRLIEGAALAAEYPTVAAVGRGSARPPCVVAFTWSGSGAGPGAKLVSLCGKGVCFDSGGYDLKPASAMLRMKKDMGGAALMLGLASAIMQQDLPLHLVVRIGCVENMVSGDAMRPLDVLRTRRGLTVEVGNTNAEGRLVLCDLLAEASDEGPDVLIDAATLTGAARVALGPELPALFTPDDALAEALARAGSAAHDPVWRLPIHSGYETWLSSPIADVNNVSSKPFAGAIVATLFLQRFLAPGTHWAHLDTHAWNEQGRPGRPEGGEALGMRGLLGFVQTLI
ncbi:MAG TPA: leucyl aminopeptidase family protein [Acetobacteraceae bacterium]|nr:leucyl aminopeptidase family protein [Acetobacteraceae bacterium]